MSYGSTFVPFDAHGRLSSKLSRPSFRKEHQERKLVHYEEEFDVNLSRIPEKQSNLRESMVEYSRKMRTIQDARISNGIAKNGDPLFVRAKHIPKYPVRTPRKRRPMSFDELLGRDRDAPRPAAAKQRPHSDKIKPTRDGEKSGRDNDDLNLPLLSDRLRKTGQNVQVSLVSASDLYDIVDFSLRNKGTRSDNLQMLRMEKDLEQRSERAIKNRQHRPNNSHAKECVPEEVYDGYERTPVSNKTNKRENKYENFNDYSDNHVPTGEFYEDIFSLEKTEFEKGQRVSNLKLPLIHTEAIKRRPNRAKRMQLFDSGLGDIPEDNILDSKGKLTEDNYLAANRRVISPPPPKQSPRHVELGINSLDAIQENVEKTGDKHRAVLITNGKIATQTGRMDNEGYLDTPRSNGYSNRKEHREIEYRNTQPRMDEVKSTKKILIRDDGDVRIEVTQCPPKQETLNTKLKAQKRFKKLIFLRDAPR